MAQHTAERSWFYPLLKRNQIFLQHFFFLLAKVRAIEYRCVFEGVSTRSLGRVSMAESPASFTVSFNDMHKTNYGGAARYARDRA
jgi:hypothetical protein